MSFRPSVFTYTQVQYTYLCFFIDNLANILSTEHISRFFCLWFDFFMQLLLTNSRIPEVIRRWLKPEVLLWHCRCVCCCMVPWDGCRENNTCCCYIYYLLIVRNRFVLHIRIQYNNTVIFAMLRLPGYTYAIAAFATWILRLTYDIHVKDKYSYWFQCYGVECSLNILYKRL